MLDRLVGYKLSPWLWKQVYRGLSAGRVQSVATRLICEREEEIQAFKPVEYWTVEGIYCTEEKESFKAKLTQVDGKEAKIHNAEEADRVVRGILKQPAEITSVTKRKSSVRQNRRTRLPQCSRMRSTVLISAPKRRWLLPRCFMKGLKYRGTDM